MPWENALTTLDTNTTKAMIADDAYKHLAALMKELAEEGSESASKFTRDYEQMHVAHGPFALALSLGAMSETIMDLRARAEDLEIKLEAKAWPAALPAKPIKPHGGGASMIAPSASEPP
jgi:hypothetical protein